MELLDQRRKLKWVNNAKFDFAGFTFHYITKPYFSKITTQTNEMGARIIRSGLYVYPDKKSIKCFKEKVKSILKRNQNSSPYKVINILNPLLRKWSNYYSVGTHRFLSKLDHFVFIRIWRYLSRKYQKTSKSIIVQRYFQGTKSPVNRTWHFHGTWNNSKSKLRNNNIVWLIIMYLLNHPLPAQTFRAENKLLDTSAYISNIEKVKWDVFIVKKRMVNNNNNYWTRLFIKQQGICPICNQELGYLTENKLEIHHIIRVVDNPFLAGKINNQQLIHKSCHKHIHSKN